MAQSNSEPLYQDIFKSTCGIIFLGTPHFGSKVATWAEVLASLIGIVKQTNLYLLKVLQQDSEVLAMIQYSFSNLIATRNKDGQGYIHIACFFEELPLPSIGVVSLTLHKNGHHNCTRINRIRSYLSTRQYFRAIFRSASMQITWIWSDSTMRMTRDFLLCVEKFDIV